MTQPRQLDRLLNCPPFPQISRLCPIGSACTVLRAHRAGDCFGLQCLVSKVAEDIFCRRDIGRGMTYTQLKTEHCPPLDMLLSGKGYFPELNCSMRRWFTEGLHKGLSTPEERAACHTLGGGSSAGIELCTPASEYHPSILLHFASSRGLFCAGYPLVNIQGPHAARPRCL